MLDLSSWSQNNNPTDPAKKKPHETTVFSSDRKRNRRNLLSSQPYVSLFLSLKHSSIGTLFLGENPPCGRAGKTAWACAYNHHHRHAGRIYMHGEPMGARHVVEVRFFFYRQNLLPLRVSLILSRTLVPINGTLTEGRQPLSASVNANLGPTHTCVKESLGPTGLVSLSAAICRFVRVWKELWFGEGTRVVLLWTAIKRKETVLSY